MRTFINVLLLIFSILLASVAAQDPPKTAVTEDGKKIVLKQDGTWAYAETKTESRPEFELRSLDEVATDRIAFIDRPVRVAGTLRPTTYYFGFYRTAEATHLAFMLNSAKGSSHAYLYMRRGAKAEKLRNDLIAAGGSMTAQFDINFSREAYEGSKGISAYVGELLDYQKPNTANSSAKVSDSPSSTSPLPSEIPALKPVDIGRGIIRVATDGDGNSYYIVEDSIKVGDKFVWFTIVADVGNDKQRIIDAKGDCAGMGYMQLKFAEYYRGSKRELQPIQVKDPKMYYPDKSKVGYDMISYVCSSSR